MKYYIEMMFFFDKLSCDGYIIVMIIYDMQFMLEYIDCVIVIDNGLIVVDDYFINIFLNIEFLKKIYLKKMSLFVLVDRLGIFLQKLI